MIQMTGAKSIAQTLKLHDVEYVFYIFGYGVPTQELTAEGFAAALQRIYEIAQTVDQKTMTLQYFETLKEMGTSPSTKYIFPMEFSKFIERFTLGSDNS